MQTEEKSSAAGFWCFFIIILMTSLPFIVCDLMFANSSTNQECVELKPSAVNLKLSTWLEVDGYLKIILVCFFLFVAITSTASI